MQLQMPSGVGTTLNSFILDKPTTSPVYEIVMATLAEHFNAQSRHLIFAKNLYSLY